MEQCTPLVTVYLSSYNGVHYIAEQIDSILNQTGVTIRLCIRDDGSTDGTQTVLKKYENTSNIHIFYGKNMGYAKSFLWLVSHDPDFMDSDYFSFSDQDDVWLPQKLNAACSMLRLFEKKTKPCLYVSALQRVDENLNKLSLQSFSRLKLDVSAEFTRHRLAGCTFLMNQKLQELLRNCTEIRTQCSHDALTTILCLSCGGEVCFDPNAYILFRRHGKNASSDNIGVIQKVCHDVCSFIKHKNQNRDLAREILRKLEVHLVTDARGFLDTISNYDSSWRKTCSLAFSDVLDCGFWYYNYFVRLMVLLRYY